MIVKKEALREFILQAVERGRERQCQITGFIHYHPTVKHQETHPTIPTYENFLFALALLRSRNGENIQEAKTLIERLLFFQNSPENDSPGNFPIYLHEFPRCYDRWHGLKLLFPMYWMLKNFSSILGASLNRKLSDAVRGLLSHYDKLVEEGTPDYLHLVSIGSTLKAFGDLWGDSSLSQFGERILQELTQIGPQSCWYSPQGLGRLLACFQLLGSNPFSSFFKPLWHPKLLCYSGPAIEEWHCGLESCQTLFDFFLFSSNENIPRLPSLQVLEGALIQNDEISLPLNELPCETRGEIGDLNWTCFQHDLYAYSVIPLKEAWHPQRHKAFHPFRMLWGGESHLHTLSVQSGLWTAMDYHAAGHQVDLFFDLEEPSENDHFSENREVIFYCSRHEETRITVEGASATVFHLGDRVQINHGLSVELTFSLIEGEGTFMGHLMPGNRPSQRNASRREITEAYDWQMILRTVKRSPKCRIKVSIQISPS